MAEYGCTPLYLTKNGKPWFPIMGEMHYSRYPKQYWKESLYKMKAGGIDIVSCYCIWIHHEEEEGVFDFFGDKDLRTFLLTAKKCGIKVLLRIGPWAHGEVRNGGFPDWLLEKKIPLRCDDPRYLALVSRYYKALANQAEGLLDTDGGPVIGVQIENEYGHVGGLKGEEGEQHMRTLQKLAIEAGFDVQIFTATGWGGAVTGGMIPVMGGYCDAPWDQRLTEIEPSGNYIFTPERNDHNIGSDVGFGHGITFDMTKFPFLTAELGGGLQVTHHRRPVAVGKDVAAMSLVKMGSGCSLLGYYMYHGGTNPDGKYSTLQESRATGYANDLPIKSYDFNAPIKEYGQLSDSYREIRLLAMFIHDFGEDFCRMVPEFPNDNPLYPTNQMDLRYVMRHNGESGYLFINNYQRRRHMADHTAVSLEVNLKDKTIKMPVIDVKNGEFFFLPVCMPLGKNVILKSAAVTPLCRIGEDTWVFYGDRDPQFEVEYTGEKEQITLLHLSREDALKSSKIMLDREYLMISDADIIPMDDGIHFQSNTKELCFKTYPPLNEVPSGFTVSLKNGYGIYRKDMTEVVSGVCAEVSVEKIAEGEDITETYTSSRKVGFKAAENGAVQELPNGYCCDGSIYHLYMTGAENAVKEPRISDAFLTLDFTGDRIEIYQNKRLISDYFYTGQQVKIGLKRFGFPDELVIKVFAYHNGDPVYLEQYPVAKSGTISQIEEAVLVPQWDVVL